MRIESISIKNFRSYKNCKVNLDAYTSLIGPNGSGKSTILEALNIFFCYAGGSTADVNFLEIEDFHRRCIKQPVEITVTFHKLSLTAQKAFSESVHNNKLIIKAIANFDPMENRARVRRYVQEHVKRDFKTFFEASNQESETDLRDRYRKIQDDIPSLRDASTTGDMQDALSKYIKSHPYRRYLVPIEDLLPIENRPDELREDTNLLEPYVQWIYVPAAKDITKEAVEGKGTILREILAYAVRTRHHFNDGIKEIKETALKQYRELLTQNQSQLKRISESLDDGLARWAHPGANARLAWIDDDEKSVRIDDPIARMFTREGGFEGEITRFGHGLQRSYFLALIEILASEYADEEMTARDNKREEELMNMHMEKERIAEETGKDPKEMRASEKDPTAPTLILGCEEPEIYQHPPQARHLADVLEKLSENNVQILISTHSPYFVSESRFERLRMVRRDDKTRQSKVSSASFNKVSKRILKITGKKLTPPTPQRARLHHILQPNLSEMFFANKIVFVEGLEDVAYITTSLIMLDKWNCFRRHGAHIVSASGKSSLIRPLVVAETLGIPTFAVFDADATKEEDANKAEKDKDHGKKNKELLTLLGDKPKIPFPAETACGDRFVQWPNNLGVTLEFDVGEEIWEDAGHQANERLGYPKRKFDKKREFDKHPIHIGYRLEILHKANNMPQSLDMLCQKIIKFLETH